VRPGFAAPTTASRAFHHELVGVLGTDGQRRISLVGTELGKLLRQRGVHLLRVHDRKLASRALAAHVHAPASCWPVGRCLARGAAL
jgi:hypothetical protein